MFTSIAPRYDRANLLLSMGTDRYWRWVTARRMAPAPGALALDVACGTGDLAMALRRRGGQVVGIDFTHAMLQQARNRDRDLLLTGGDALRLPFADSIFDRLTVAFGVRNFADLSAGLREFHRVLRPGGQAGILEFSPPKGLLAPAARFYMARVMPLLGRLVSGRDGPYDYLADSIRTWPDPERLASMLADAGFSRVHWRRFTAGVATLHVAHKDAVVGTD
jgi:demethylmenaquinone methyltransferase/2-methoxy-6-polyprenyl-1,4-benzoquinol methylase